MFRYAVFYWRPIGDTIQGRTLIMYLHFSPDENAFREEVRQFVKEKLPADIRNKVMNGVHLNRDEHILWQRTLHQRGWGGPGWTPAEQYIFEEECAAGGAPRLISFGLKMIAPVLMAFGNPAQCTGRDIVLSEIHCPRSTPLKSRKLHTLHRPAKKHNGHPPLVFVHGGYVHAGCWDVNFLPHFSKLGYHCHAIDLSGHGASEGRENLNSYDLDHYAADVAQVVAELPAPPVLIGHSMGALVVQRYLEKGNAAAVIMMAPVPTTGLAGCSAQLNVRQPDFLREAAYAVRGKYTANTVKVMREVYFSPDVTAEQFAAFKPLVQDESMTAVTEMMTLAWRSPKRRPKIPALVMGGELDALFPSNQLYFTASGWNAETCVIPRAGHMIMMEPHWTAAADKIDNWLDRRLGQKAAA